MNSKLNKIEVTITRLISPAEFWIELQNRTEHQNRCHLFDQTCREGNFKNIIIIIQVKTN